MHDIMPPLGAGAQLIQSYGAGSFRIGNVVYDTPVVVTSTATYLWSGELSTAALAPLLLASPSGLEVEKVEILLIGTGKRHAMLSPELRAGLKAQGIAVDSMDTGAACRTFNILLGEGRRVAAALLLVSAD